MLAYNRMAINLLLTLKIASLILILIYLSACVQKPWSFTQPCLFPNQQIAPGWVCDQPFPGLALQAVGRVNESVAGQNYMFDMANIAARKHLIAALKKDASQRVILYLESINIQNSDATQAGASVKKTIQTHSLALAKQYESAIGPEGRAYVLVGFEQKSYQALLEKLVSTSISNDPASWLKFQTVKPLDIIAAEIAVKKVIE